jgi:hypothetical protein
LSRPKESPATCPLCKIIGGEKVERVLINNSTPGKQPGKLFFIVATKNKKGHEFRYMIVLDEHASEIDPETEKGAVAEFFKFMRGFHVDFAIMESTHATISDHWHRVGTDLNPNAEDADQVRRTERFEVAFKRAENR